MFFEFLKFQGNIRTRQDFRVGELEMISCKFFIFVIKIVDFSEQYLAEYTISTCDCSVFSV